MSEAVLEKVEAATGANAPATGGKAATGTGGNTGEGLTRQSLERSIAAQLRGSTKGKTDAGGDKGASGGAGLPGTGGKSAEAQSATASGQGSSPGAAHAAGAPGEVAGAAVAGAPSTENGSAPDEGGESGNAGADGTQNGGQGSQWPKSAIDVVTRLRAENRELKAKEGKADGSNVSTQKATATDTVKGGQQTSGTTGIDAVPAELREEAAAKQGMIVWARTAAKTLRTNPDAVVAELQQHGIRLADTSPEGVADWLAQVREDASTELARVTARIELAQGQASQVAEANRQAATAAALEFMPELAAQEPNARKERYEQILAAHPELQGHPRGAFAAMVQVLGLEALDAMVSAKGTSVPATSGNTLKGGHQTGKATAQRPAVTKLPNGSGPAPGVATGKKVSSSDLFKAYQKSGKAEDREVWMKSMLSL